MKIFLLCIVATSIFASSSNKPLVKDHQSIVGGEEASPGQFPYLLSFTKYGSHFCAASILNETTALTAAHCVYGKNPSNPNGLQVVAGQHSLKMDDSTEEIIDVDSFVYHENFNIFTLANDIAILYLASPITMNDFAQTIPLPEQSQETNEGSCVVAGWGTTEFDSPWLSDIVQYVDVPYVNDDECRENLGYLIWDSMICAGEEGKDSCQGDSGGPMVCEGYHAGIVSWGVGCGEPHHPGVYTQVSYFIDWINAHR